MGVVGWRRSAAKGHLGNTGLEAIARPRAMTGNEIRQRICGGARSFTLATAEIKARVGHPNGIRILPRWCRRTGRDVLVLTYETEDGQVQVLGTVGFLNSEETIFDGWVVVIDRTKDSVQIYGEPASIAVQQSLFEEWVIVPAEAADDDSASGQEQNPDAYTKVPRGTHVTEDERTLFDDMAE